MEEYPRNLMEFESSFATEEDCRAYLVRLRWPEGFRCRRCGCEKSWPVRGVLVECAGCGYQTSVTAGTIFQDTRTPLPVWFRAMWWVTTQKNGGLNPLAFAAWISVWGCGRCKNLSSRVDRFKAYSLRVLRHCRLISASSLSW